MFLCVSESFRWDLNEAKAVYVAEYYLVCRFCNYDAPITSQVSINKCTVINLFSCAFESFRRGFNEAKAV